MLNINLNKFGQMAVLVLGLLTVALVIFAQAQSKKEEKKPRLKDAVVREGRNRIRAKSGYELIKDSETTVAVRKKGATVVLGKIRCSVCPGPSGGCGTATSSDGSVSCIASTDCSSSSCWIDPF